MTSHTTAKSLLGCKLLTLLAVFLLVLVPTQALSSDLAQDHSLEDEKQEATASGHGRHHGHIHGNKGCGLNSAIPEKNLSPEQLARETEIREKGLAKAHRIYRSMGVDPAVTALGLGFDYDGRCFDLGMTLEQALIRVLAGGNRCRFKHTPQAKICCQLEIISKDKSVLSLVMQPARDKLLIQGMTLRKLDCNGRIKENGARAAFYLMTFMRAK
ncbi:MAG: hypothetical protein P8Y00_02665 [Deltaproteobacteria bacterium]